jgi:acyl-CoA synthetase (AMP-forming)/AMP-acid ligase II
MSKTSRRKYSADGYRSPFAASTMVELLQRRAELQPERIAYKFLIEGEEEGDRLTYRELDRRARALGAWLQSIGAAGQRILLFYPPGLDYLSAFFGCMYAGAVAVPAYPPRHNRNLTRLQAIIADTEAMATLTTSQILSSFERHFERSLGLKPPQWLATDIIVNDPQSQGAELWTCPRLKSGDLAFLQYTSGSTSAPKGVMVSHGNLLHNEGLLQEAYEVSEQSVIVCWLPLYHDMGLIGNALQSVYSGAPGIFMSPAAFLQRPMRWLQAINRYRATISGGPNFAYDLCVQKISREERASLDLSSWRVAFNGSEPIRHDTLERFAKEFEECGFRREGLFSGYGLAEATLAVTASRPVSGPVICRVQKSALEDNRVVLASQDDIEVRALVSCGKVYGGQRLIIADPKFSIECKEGQVGEIWLTGRSIAQGYWNRPEETARTFDARLAGRQKTRFLRTGDLGFTLEGHLYIVGRLKDLIIIRGRNHHPQDIELTVERSDPALRPGCGAAFTIEVEGEERLVIVQELERSAIRNLHDDGIVWRIYEAIAEQHEIQAHQVVLVKPGSISKTSSGKIQRRATMERFLNGTLNVLRKADLLEILSNSISRYEQTNSTGDIQQSRSGITNHGLAASRSERVLTELWTKVLGMENIGAHDDFFSLGGNSLLASKLISHLRDTFQINLMFRPLFEHTTIASLSEYIDRIESAGHTEIPPIKQVERGQELPLSFAQERLWFIEQLEPGNDAYNMPGALLIRGRLNVEALQLTLNEIVKRHESLRTIFTSLAGQPVQVVVKATPVNLPITDLNIEPETNPMSIALQQATIEIRQPFDLSSGPLMRARLLRLGEEEHVLVITIHHIACDGWSMGVLVLELTTLYEAFSCGKPSPLPELAIQYGDYSVWQRDWLQGKVLESQLAYWQRQLAGAPLVTKLPFDRQRHGKMGFHGACERLVLPISLIEALKELSQRERATLFMTLLAAFQTLLHRYSGQEDLIVGTDIANRRLSETEGLIGFFVNLLALRVDLSGDPSFRELLGRVKEVTIDAIAHQDVPFGKVVEVLHPERGWTQTPFIQVLCVLQSVPMPPLRLGDLEVSLLPIDNETAEFELILTMEEIEEGLGCSFKYNVNLFERETIARMVGKYRRLLESVVDNPDQRLSTIQLLTKDEGGGLAITDFPGVNLSQRDFENLISNLSGLGSQ